jgi:hypothetical protein
LESSLLEDRERDVTTTKAETQSGYSVSEPRFEPGTSLTPCSCVNHYTARGSYPEISESSFHLQYLCFYDQFNIILTPKRG